MKKGKIKTDLSLIEQNQEIAFSAYVLGGGNLTEAQKFLKKKGYKFDLSTLSRWADKFNWKVRLAEADKAVYLHLRGNRADKIVTALMNQVDSYINYFAPLTAPDPQATYAFAHLCRELRGFLTDDDGSISKSLREQEQMKNETALLIAEVYGMDVSEAQEIVQPKLMLPAPED